MEEPALQVSYEWNYLTLKSFFAAKAIWLILFRRSVPIVTRTFTKMFIWFRIYWNILKKGKYMVYSIIHSVILNLLSELKYVKYFRYCAKLIALQARYSFFHDSRYAKSFKSLRWLEHDIDQFAVLLFLIRNKINKLYT